MSDKPTAEMLTFGTSTSNMSSNASLDYGVTTSNTPAVSSIGIDSPAAASHLSQTRSRSETNISGQVKRIKHNSRSKSDQNSLRQLETAKLLVYEAIDLVFENKPLKYGYGFYNQKVEAICKYKHAEQSGLSEHLKNQIEQNFSKDIQPQITQLVRDEKTPDILVKQYLQIYHEWQNKLRLLEKLFLYLDRNYLLLHPNKKVILEFGLELFVDNLVADSVEEAQIVISKYTRYLYQGFEQENPDDLELLAAFTKMMIKLNFSNKIKQNTKIIDLCVNLAKDLSVTWLKTPETYIHHVLRKTSKIVTFFKDCGKPASFCEKLLKQLKWVTIFADFNQVIQNCLVPMLYNDDHQQLTIIYSFCELTVNEYGLDSIPIFVLRWGQVITQEVNKAIEEEQSQPSGDLINKLVQIYNHYKHIMETKLKRNEKFEFEIRHSYNRSLNATRKVNTFIISQLCKYSDTFLKNKKSATSYEDFESKFMVIFKFLNNKNDFIVNYKNQLSRRLLLGKNSSVDLEKRLVDSISNIVGENEDSIGLSTMFKDLSRSHQSYSALKGLGNDTIEFNGLVLEKKHWPEIPNQDASLVLPKHLKSMLDNFEQFYKSQDDKYKNHALDWGNYNLHQLVIVARFDSGEYELNVNLLQALIIDLFNDKDALSVAELSKLTKMDSKLLRRVVLSLSDKYKILIEEDDEVKFNHTFSDKSKKLKIPLPRSKDVSATNYTTDHSVITRNRDAEIRALLVRILKTETRIPFTELTSKILEVAVKKGPVSIQEVKSNIEFLITKEYISRDKEFLIYVP